MRTPIHRLVLLVLAAGAASGTWAADSATGPAATAPPQRGEILFWESIIHWESVEAEEEAAMYQAYLAQYPEGAFASLARLRLGTLGRAGAPALEPVASASATLTVHTLEAGARIYIDHRDMGTSGRVSVDLPPGKHLVRVVKPGHEEVRTRVDLAAGGSERVEIVMQDDGLWRE